MAKGVQDKMRGNVLLTKGIAGSMKVRIQPFLFLIFATFTYLFAASIILGESEYTVYPINFRPKYPVSQ